MSEIPSAMSQKNFPDIVAMLVDTATLRFDCTAADAFAAYLNFISEQVCHAKF
jgi:hypothetical protein